MPYATNGQNPKGWRGGAPSGWSDPTGPQKIEDTERAARAVVMRREGAAWEEVKRELGYSNRSTARRAVLGALAKTLKRAGVDELREEMSATLDDLEDVASGLMLESVEKARGAQEPAEERAYYELALRAQDRIVRLLDRRAKLHGLDEPVTVPYDRLVFEAAQRRGITLTKDELRDAVEGVRALHESVERGELGPGRVIEGAK